MQVLVERGLVSEDEAMTHPRRNVITASLRGDEGDLVHVTEGVPVLGDRWLLCSDGVSDYLRSDDIAAVLQRELVPQDAARALVALALEAGSRDNVTAVVVDVVDDASDTEEAPVFAGAAAVRFTEELPLD